MKRPRRRSWIIAVTVTILLALLVSAVWVAAVERWIGHELHVFAAKHVNPTFAFDDLRYRFPRTVTLRGVRLTSAYPKAKSGETDILTVASLTLSLAEIPQPNKPFLAQRLDLSTPTLRLVRMDSGETSDKILGYSDFLKGTSESEPRPVHSPTKVSGVFQARTLLISDGRVEFDQGDDGKGVMLIDGIDTKLVLQPDHYLTPAFWDCRELCSVHLRRSSKAPKEPVIFRYERHASAACLFYRPSTKPWTLQPRPS